MLEMIMDRHLPFLLLGAVVAIGLISKIITGVTLKKLVKAAANMGKSTHPLMRLIRAKYEHACMVSGSVQNAEVFIEKYIYEYRIAGLPLHSWRRIERGAAWICAAIGVLAALGEYALRGMSDQVLRNGVFGLAAGIILFVLRVSVDENYRLQAIRTYMVDYLDNFCARKYEKNREKSFTKRETEPEQEKAQGMTPELTPEKISEVMSEKKKDQPEPKFVPENVPVREPAREPERTPATEPARDPVTEPTPERTGEIYMAENKSEEKEEREAKRDNRRKQAQDAQSAKQDRNVPKEVLIREILEEYLA